ncbi:MAG: hypothetical protein VKK04_12830 [Synechococcales bacterium]|nr:hypothetical protein [Synechococcales bacterium]
MRRLAQTSTLSSTWSVGSNAVRGRSLRCSLTGAIAFSSCFAEKDSLMFASPGSACTRQTSPGGLEF